MKRTWFAYYKNHKNIYLSNILLHWPYLYRILQLRPKSVLEIGCGPADHSVFLSYLLQNTRISLLDYDKDIIVRLKNKLKNKIYKFYLCDLVDKKGVKRSLINSRFDIIYSQGLMEHFSKNNFQKVILNLLPYANKLIFSVPSEAYPNRDFGNELLRNKGELELILRQIKNISYKISPYFPDIGYRTKKLKIRKSKLNLFRAVHFYLFGSCHYLIEITEKKPI